MLKWTLATLTNTRVNTQRHSDVILCSGGCSQTISLDKQIVVCYYINSYKSNIFNDNNNCWSYCPYCHYLTGTTVK